MKAFHMIALMSLVVAAPALADQAIGPEHVRRVSVSCEFRDDHRDLVSPQNRRFEKCKSLASLVVRTGHEFDVENGYNRLAIACEERRDGGSELVYSDGAVVTKFHDNHDRFLKLQAPNANTPKILIKFDHDLKSDVNPNEGFRSLLVLDRQTLFGDCRFHWEDAPTLD